MLVDIKNLTLEDVIVEGMKLWYWLYRNPGKYKSDYFSRGESETELFRNSNNTDWLEEVLDIDDELASCCFPCTYSETQDLKCVEGCPLHDGYCSGESDCIFEEWTNSKSQSELAWQMVVGHFEIELPYDINDKECSWYEEGICTNLQARGSNDICDIEPSECIETGFKWKEKE